MNVIHRAGRLLLFALGAGVAGLVTYSAVELFFQDNRIFPPAAFPVYLGLVGLYLIAALAAVRFTRVPRSVLLGSAAALAVFGQVLWHDYLPSVEVRCGSQELQAAIDPIPEHTNNMRTWQKDEAGRVILQVEGPPQFEASTRRVLTELLNCAPERYTEAGTYLSQAIYDPDLAYPNKDDPDARGAFGRADGRFSFDGSGLSYYFFRYVFLHEVGHNVMMACCNDRSEESAHAYANMVLLEIKRR